MMRWIVGSSLKSLRVVVVAAVVLMTFGVWQLRDAKVDVLPEFSPPTVEVQTEALGLSAEEVEQLITVPLEQDLLDGVAWLDTIHSRSVPGLSSVELVFERGTDLYRARQVVQERISQAAGLPNVSRPPQMLQPKSSTSRTAMVALSSKKLSAIQIGVLARWTIRPRLLSVPGVSNVAIWGQRERQLQVQVDPQKLRDKNVTLEQVISSAGNALWVSPLTFLEASSPGTGGFIDTPNQRLGIQHNLPIIKPADLGAISLDDTSAAPLTIGDVATVVEDHQPLIGDAIVNGNNEAGFLLVIDKLPSANTSKVTEGVENALDDLRPGLVGLDIDTSFFRPASYVDRSVDNVRLAIVIGAVLLLLVLAALLFSWRRVVTVLMAIATSFIVAATVLHLFGATFNIVVFAGLVMALTVVVDDAIVNVERIHRRYSDLGEARASNGTSAATIVREVSLETSTTVVWATAVFVLALVPIFLMNGLSGDSFFPPVAVACLLAVLVSMLVAMTVTPALSLLLLSKERSQREPPLTRMLGRGYDRVRAALARAPIAVLVAVLVVGTAGAIIGTRSDKALLPPLKDTNLLIHWEAPFGTSLPEMDRITARAAAELRTVAGVRNVGAHVGQAVLGDQAVGSDSAEMWVRLDPSADYNVTVGKVQAVVDGYTGMNNRVVTYSKDRMREVLARTGDEITVRLFGTDLGVLHAKAEEVKQGLSGIDGVVGEHVASPASEPTMEIEVNLAKATSAGIKPGDVRRAAATLLSGLRVGNLFEDQKVFDVVVWSTPETRHSLSSVRDLVIDTPAGQYVRLGDVADVRVRATVPSIEHQDVSRFVDVTANVSNRDVGAVANAVEDRLAHIQFPTEYHAEVLGEYSHQQDAQRRLLGIVIAAAIGMFLLLQAAFRSWRVALLVFVTLPVALVGGVIAASFDGGPMTLATVAGLLATLALTVRHNMFLVGRIRRLRAELDLPFSAELIGRAASDRLAPTVMSALTTVTVLVPAVALGEIPGLEVVHPMAIVVLGGLVTSTLATLFVLPALYLWLGPRDEPELLELEAQLDLTEVERALATADGAE